jgi:hypothetical protein
MLYTLDGEDLLTFVGVFLVFGNLKKFVVCCGSLGLA